MGGDAAEDNPGQLAASILLFHIHIIIISSYQIIFCPQFELLL
jgi:hypothetical protein